MNVLAFVIAFILFLAGMAMFALAFTITAGQPFVFVGGILLIAISLALPFHAFGHGEQR